MDLVVNTPFGRGPRTDGSFIRTAAVRGGNPVHHNGSGVLAAVQGIEALRGPRPAPRSLQEYHAARPPASATGCEHRIGRDTGRRHGRRARMIRASCEVLTARRAGAVPLAHPGGARHRRGRPARAIHRDRHAARPRDPAAAAVLDPPGLPAGRLGRNGRDRVRRDRARDGLAGRGQPHDIARRDRAAGPAVRPPQAADVVPAGRGRLRRRAPVLPGGGASPAANGVGM